MRDSIEIFFFFARDVSLAISEEIYTIRSFYFSPMAPRTPKASEKKPEKKTPLKKKIQKPQTPPPIKNEIIELPPWEGIPDTKKP